MTVKGGDDEADHRTRYTMIAVCPLLYVVFKLVKKTKIISAHEIDLQKNMAEIAEYERTYVPTPPK
jgi:amino acid transporter